LAGTAAAAAEPGCSSGASSSTITSSSIAAAVSFSPLREAVSALQTVGGRTRSARLSGKMAVSLVAMGRASDAQQTELRTERVFSVHGTE